MTDCLNRKRFMIQIGLSVKLSSPVPISVGQSKVYLLPARLRHPKSFTNFFSLSINHYWR